jgi:HD superfamily phosphohydrolase
VVVPIKRINDPLYGAAFLTELEFSIFSCPAFLRLGGVKQLGLGSLVYPSAGYTRLAHSVGVCHLTGLALDSIQKNTGVRLDEQDIILTRLAALLHDVGHYPFSHAVEEVVKELSGEDLLEGGGESGGGAESVFFADHEDVGRFVVENDSNIMSALGSSGIEPKAVFDRLKGSDGSRLNLILSSDLDCDRLDYLRRTSLHAGLPYGGVDVNYLIDNLTLDDEGIPCVNPRAIGPADHFLMSRSYDYAQLPFHKAVVGFEEALKKVLVQMHHDECLDLRSSTISSMLKSGEWQHFDDQRIFEKMRSYQQKIETDSSREDVLIYLRSIFERRAPKLVYSMEYMSQEGDSENREFESYISVACRAAEEIFSKFNISDRRWFMWKNTFALMKGKESGQRIQVQRTVNGSLVGSDLNEDTGTLTSSFQGAVRRHIRLYACLIDRDDPKELRDQMRSMLDSRISELNLVDDSIVA